LTVSVRIITTLWISSVLTPGAAMSDETRLQTPVILISIDTLRADHLSAYGYQKIHTPHIDSFAQDGTLFAEAETQVPLTLPAHTSLLTSTYPFENRVEENAERVSSGVVTLASVLRAHGYKTAAFIGSIFLERQLGLNQGFDTYDSPFSFEAGSRIAGSMIFAGVTRNPYAVRQTRDGALVVRSALQWLDAHRGQPVFVFVHLFDVHEHESVPAALARQRGLSRYDVQVDLADRLIGRFQKALAQTGWWDRSLTVLLSDHGESLGEHGETNHGYFIYQSTAWVPLIFHWPAGTPGCAPKVRSPAGLIDVAPTILDFLHLAAPPAFEGRSLNGVIHSLKFEDPRPVYSESVYTHDAFGWAPLRSLRMGGYKYIEAPRPELYNLATDPQEKINLAGENSEQARNLRIRLQKLLARSTPNKQHSASDIAPETRRLLESLGYLSRGPETAHADSNTDPTDRLPEYHLYEQALTALYDRRMDEAIAIFRRILAQNPDNTLARRDLGDCYIELRSYRKARATLKKVVAVAPDDYMAQLELGVADEHLGRLHEAFAHVQSACRLFPDSAQCRKELETIRAKMK
jgi:arylsulfatase A-like enzyme